MHICTAGKNFFRVVFKNVDFLMEVFGREWAIFGKFFVFCPRVDAKEGEGTPRKAKADSEAEKVVNQRN